MRWMKFRRSLLNRREDRQLTSRCLVFSPNRDLFLLRYFLALHDYSTESFFGNSGTHITRNIVLVKRKLSNFTEKTKS